MASWIDGLMATPPDAFRLTQLAQVCQSVYVDNFGLWKGDGITGIKQLWDGPPRVWTITIDGVKIACCEGTTVFPWQYLAQETGWSNPSPWGSTGFVNAYVASVAQQIFPALPNDIQVFVGHSLGGSVASVLAALAKQAGLTPAAVVTFAAPKTFSSPVQTPAGLVPQQNIWAANDPVPSIPPNGYAGLNWDNPGSYNGVFGPIGFSPTTPAVLDPIDLTAVILGGGIGDHATSNYLNLLTGIPANPIPLPASITRGPTMPGPYFTTRVAGRIAGQSVQNILSWESQTTTPPNALSVALAIQDHWRTYVLPKVSAAYSVLTYTAVKIENVQLYAPTDKPKYSRWRYNDAAAVSGDASDIGIKASAPAASFMAFGLQKACAPWVWGDDGTPVVFGGLARGSMRLGGVLESDTVDNDNDQLNQLVAARLMDLKNIALNMTDLVHETVIAKLVVLRKDYAGAPLEKPAGTGAFQVSEVTALAANPYVTSQVSRKQSARNLG